MSRAPRTSRAERADPDERAVRRASRTVGILLTVATSILVLAVVVAAFAYVTRRIPAGYLFTHREARIAVRGQDLLVGAIGIGLVAVALAALIGWFATRRAVRPIGRALHLQREFVANASHELRTPVAVLDARLQLLERQRGRGEEVGATIEDLRRDADTVVRVVDDLLDAAEGGPGRADPIAVGPVVDRAAASVQLLAEERGIRIAAEITGSARVAIPPAALERSVIALLDNAVRHSPDGGEVRVRVGGTGSAATIRVEDAGSGILGIDPDAVFERFATGTPVGGRPGSGIGLALVRDTAERARGEVVVVSTGPDGTVVELRLPRSS